MTLISPELKTQGFYASSYKKHTIRRIMGKNNGKKIMRSR
ncbi:Uncharacterized protein conserved in archaea (DUF531) [Methanosarcina sp. WWM596]|nr:Uncharacterized protein conserved in archaea (DUF531) [Methanosarcina sp. WWM596]AKB22596.1 Uncharacterized protein conserved in archaea (DUF531) [Methanosarcina sp. WH1]